MSFEALAARHRMHWILNGHDIVEEPDLIKWAMWFSEHLDERIVAQDFVGEAKR